MAGIGMRFLLLSIDRLLLLAGWSGYYADTSNVAIISIMLDVVEERWMRVQSVFLILWV